MTNLSRGTQRGSMGNGVNLIVQRGTRAHRSSARIHTDGICMAESVSPRVNCRRGRDQNVLPAREHFASLARENRSERPASPPLRRRRRSLSASRSRTLRRRRHRGRRFVRDSSFVTSPKVNSIVFVHSCFAVVVIKADLFAPE